MKIKNLFCCAALVSLLAVSTGYAQLEWDPALTPATPSGGSGTWDPAIANWSNLATDQLFDGNNAVFGAPAGAVTVTGTNNATGLTFNVNGYTLGGAGTINFTGATPTISGNGGQVINTLLSSTTGVTITGGSKAFGGNNVNLDGPINMDGTPGLVLTRVNHSNGLGDSALLADRLNIVNGGSGAVLQLGNGVVLPKYIVTNGSVEVQVLGTTSFTGNVQLNGGALIYDLQGAATVHTLSGSAGLGATGQSVQVGRSGRLIVDAVAGATAYGLFIRDSATVQVNSGATLGSANVFFTGALYGGAGTTPALAINGTTVSNNLFLDASSSVQPRVENMAAGTSTLSGQVFSNGGNYAVLLRSTTTGTLDVTGHVRDTGSVQVGNATFANSGIVRLSRAVGNVYDGGTSVHSGTLLANNTSGSATGTGSVSVANTAILGGTGIIAPEAANGITVAFGGSIAPGASATPGQILTLNLGTLGQTGEVTMDNGSIFSFDLGAAGLSLAAPGTSDLLSLTGASIGDFNFAALGNTVNLVGGSVGYYKLFDTSLANATVAGDSWDNLTYDETSGLVASGLTSSGNAFYVGTASNGGDLGDIYVQVIPEPTTFVMLIGSLGLLGIMRRRRSGAVG